MLETCFNSNQGKYNTCIYTDVTLVWESKPIVSTAYTTKDVLGYPKTLSVMYNQMIMKGWVSQTKVTSRSTIEMTRRVGNPSSSDKLRFTPSISR